MESRSLGHNARRSRQRARFFVGRLRAFAGARVGRGRRRMVRLAGQSPTSPDRCDAGRSTPSDSESAG